MSQTPSAELTQLLEQWGLATVDQLRELSARVARLARGMPLLDCLWVDALVRARLLTPFQAAEIIAGRGWRLAAGPYVLSDRLIHLGYATAFSAQRLDDDAPAWIHVVELSDEPPPRLERQLATLVDRSMDLQPPGILPPLDAGIDGQRLWAACRWVEARTAADWMVHNGRFAPAVVLQTARQMAAGLAELEKQGLVHGDVSTRQLLIGRRGQVWLPLPGLRGLVRPEEGHMSADVPPETFDYLAPERVSMGTPPTVTSDLFACGCVWWHMLTGRPPLAGGSSASKLRAVEDGRMESLDRYVRDVPGALSSAIAACTQTDPAQRPESMSRLSALLGPPEDGAKSIFSRAKTIHMPLRRVSSTRIRRSHSSRWAHVGLAAAAGCLVCLPIVLWPLFNGSSQPIGRGDMAQQPTDGTPEVPRPFQDPFVEPAAFEAPAVAERDAADDPAALQLPAGKWQLGELPLKTGQTVRGPRGARPLVAVDAAGLRVDVNDVRFENIDFIWDHAADTDSATLAMIQLHARAVHFDGCTFQAAGDAGNAPVAIRVAGLADAADSLDTLPTVRLQITGCVFAGVRAGVELATPTALVVSCENTLFLGPGSFVRLTGAPRADQPVSVALRQFTLREAESVLACRFQNLDDQPGQIALETTDCVFAPRDAGALLIFTGDQKPARLLAGTHWTGHGSLMSSDGALVLWRDGRGQSHVADDDAVDVDGLVRGQIEFAGAADATAAESRIIRWQAPLRSTKTPGVGPLPTVIPSRFLPVERGVDHGE